MRDGFIKVAAVTPDIRVADCEYNAEQICKKMKEAAALGSKIIVFPELCITGYTCEDLFWQEVLLNGAKDALDQIRPFLQRDGGDIEFVEYTDDNIVKVRLQGHCAGCPGAQMTIKGVVEKILKESYPEVAGVEAVM